MEKYEKSRCKLCKIFLLDNYQGVLYTKKVRLDRPIDTAKKCEVNDVHITLEADYAVRIVQVLAQSNKRLDAKTISEMTGVTLRFSLKILRKLVAAGIIRSFKGTQGGYEIGRPLDEISLGEVIETIEGRYTLNRCITGEYACTRKKGQCCKFQKVFREISEDVREKLYSYKFTDFVD